MAYQIGHFEKVRALSAGGRILAVGGVRVSGSSQITLYDFVANKSVRSIDVPAHVLGLVTAGDQLFAACSDGTARVFEISSGKELHAVQAHEGGVHGIAVSKGGDRVATVGADGYLRMYRVGAGGALDAKAPERAWKLSAAALRAVAFDPAGEFVGAAGDDGVVRSIALESGAQRDMAGHAGPVFSLSFTPRDGRLVSGGDDGTIRIWYLVGEIEHETRGADGNGHTGAVTSLVFLPQPSAAKDDSKDLGDRLLSAGADGKIRIWRLEDRRKPRTLDLGAQGIYALAFASATSSREGLGSVFAGSDKRAVLRYGVDAQAVVSDSSTVLDHGFAALSVSLNGQKPARESAVKTLSALEEPEALEMMLRVLRSDRDSEIRLLAANLLGAKERRGARAKLREALDDEHASVRAGAFEALRAIEKDQPLSPLRAALSARNADMRSKAVVELAKVRDASPLVPGLIAERLADKDAGVRLQALSTLMGMNPGNPSPLRTAYERGPADLKVEALIQATIAGWLSTPELDPIVTRALDADESDVRRIAFAARVLERRALSHVLEARDEDLARTIRDIARRIAQIRQGLVAVLAEAGKQGKAAEGQAVKISDEAVNAARAAIPGVGQPGAELTEEDLGPLLTAMACRTPETAVRGARGLAQLGDTRALGALLQLTRESDSLLRRQAATALQELNDARAKKRLAWMLDDGDAAVRAAALDAYAKLEANEPLVVAEAALRSSHEDIRIRGLDRLVKLPAKGEREPEAETLLADAIEDESSKVRGEAFRTLWSWHDKDPVKALDRALEARFPDLRQKAVDELKEQGKHAWALERLEKTIGDRDAQVALAAYEAVVKIRGKEPHEPHLAAMGSVHPSLRAAGAKGAASAQSGEAVRSALMKLLEDQHGEVRLAAVETLDKLFPSEAGPIHAGLQGSFLDLRVRAAEILAVRHDEQLIDPMRALLADKTLFKELPIQVLGPLRMRASSALATLGSSRLVKYFATELLKDEYGDVREQAARGLAMAARKGEEGYLLDAMGHADVAVRSWAADGLARLGDVRALPVLTGTLRHEHPPIRIATIMSFAALGPEGYGGMLQGLEDSAREVQEIVFALVLARDLRAFRRNEPPDLLTSALSSQRSDVRFAAARALELRTDPEAYMAHLIEVLMPPKPEKAADMKEWPAEVARGRILVGLAEALASDNSQQRYAAAQVLRLRRKPLDYFREAKRVGGLRAAGTPFVADTTPRAAEESDTKPTKGWLRRLFARGEELLKASGDGEAAPKEAEQGAGAKVGKLVRRLFTGDKSAPAAEASQQEVAVPEGEQRRLRWLAFGAYCGLLRQVSAGDEEGHRVRRDAIDRIVDLCIKGHVSSTAAVPPLVRALDDPHHLVRKAALSGLKQLFPEGSDEPLMLGLGSVSPDVARAALDELAGRGAGARPQIVRALNSSQSEVRRYAFELLERLSEKGSLDPLLAALGSEHADLRIGVIERLTNSSDTRIVPALCKAMESDHDDLRLRAAELLARYHDDRAVDVLATFLRSDQAASVSRAREALSLLASGAAVRALAARAEDATPDERATLVRALGNTRNAEAIEPLCARFEDEAAEVRTAAFDACLEIGGRDRKKRNYAIAMQFLRAAVRAKDPDLRRSAANELDAGDDSAAEELLQSLFSDRDVPTRVAAVDAYSKRVVEKKADVAPLEAVLKAGARELMLSAAEGVAVRALPSALRPLLLFVRAGEPGQRERALLALGTLGDARAVEELETVAGGGTKEAPVEVSMQEAAIEALGRIANKIADLEVQKRLIDRVEQAFESKEEAIRLGSIRGLRYIGGEKSRVLLERSAARTERNNEIRCAAIAELGLLGDQAAEATIAEGLDHWDDDVREHARKALEKLFPNDRTRVEFLAVGSDYEDISEPAATYLAKEAEPSQLLPRLATIKDENLRFRLTMGLLQRPSLPAADLAKLLSDDRSAARKDAAFLIASRTALAEAAGAGLSDEDRAVLSGALADSERRTAERWLKTHEENERDGEAEAWREMIWAARRIGARSMTKALSSVVSGGDKAAPPSVRREAARSLKAMGSAADADALVKALKDLDPNVRSASAVALSALVPDQAAKLASNVQPFDPVAFQATAAVAPAAVRDALLSSSPGRRLVLPTMLFKGETDTLLSIAQNAADAGERCDAIAALGRVGGDAAIALLQTLAFDKKGTDIAVRKAAYRAYRRAKRKAEKNVQKNVKGHAKEKGAMA